MFLGIEWYWWLLIVLIVAVSIPFKVKFMKRIGKRQREKKLFYYWDRKIKPDAILSIFCAIF